MKRALLLTVLLSTSARAEIGVSAGSASVSLSVPRARPSEQAIESHGDQIEIPLAGDVAPARLDVEDATIKRVELRGAPLPRLRIKLHHGRRFTAQMATRVVVEPAGSGVQIKLPRDPYTAPPRTPATAPAKLDPPTAEPPKVSEPPKAPEPVTQPATVAFPPDPIEAARPSRLPEEPAPRRSPMLLVMGALAALGVAGAWLRKRRNAGASTPRIRVLANQSVGARARVVLVGVGGREILLSVGEKGARVLDRWSNEPAPPEPERVPLAELSASPAVAGLVRLRQQDSAQAARGIHPDEAWASELISATGRKAAR